MIYDVVWLDVTLKYLWINLFINYASNCFWLFFMVSDLQICIIFIVSCDIDDWKIEILQIKKIINYCINMLNIHIWYFFLISMFPLYSNVLNLLFQIFVQIWNTRCVNYSFRKHVLHVCISMYDYVMFFYICMKNQWYTPQIILC